MRFLIVPASDDMISETNDGDLFTGEDGNEYMYSVEFDGETVCITDTVGRIMPIDVSDLERFMFIFNRINNYVKSTHSLNQFLYDKLVQGASK